MQTYKDQTLAAIVSHMHQAAAIFENYELDFCCKGKRTLQAACIEKQLPLDEIETALHQVADQASQVQDSVTNAMTVSQLTDYIVLKHHLYVRQAIPLIYQHVEKVALKHGDRYPFMPKVLYLFTVLQHELSAHLHKEEQILFPRIKELEQAFQQNIIPAASIDYLSQPILRMETEHEEAGNILAEIRQLTNNYTAPADACTTFRISLAELKEFEEDLHRHVHLENNILFPRALQLIQQARRSGL